MRKGPIGLGHAQRVLALLEGGAATVGRVDQLSSEPVDHGLFRALAGNVDDPADRQGLPADWAYLDRHLIGRAADPARAYLEGRLDVVEGLVEQLQRSARRAALHFVE